MPVKLKKAKKHITKAPAAGHKKRVTVAHKTVTIRPHHAKPYRKRHYGLLIVSVAALLFLVGLAVALQVKVNIGNQSAATFFSNLFNVTQDQNRLTSQYGFSFSYDPRQFYASAINGQDGTIYQGQELATARPYQLFKLSSSAVATTKNPDALTVDYHVNDQLGSNTKLTDIETRFIAVSSKTAPAPVKVSSVAVAINGTQYQKTVWKQPVSGVLADKLSTQFVTYTSVLNDRPLIVRTNNRLTISQSTKDIDALVSTLQYAPATARAAYGQPVSVILAASHSRTVLNSRLYTQVAKAVSSNTQSSSLTNALYSPAVVKIYNVYCTDIQIKGQAYLTDACNALTGSGFFVSGDGYIATNGHVATSDPKDLVLNDAITQLVENSDPQYIQALSQLAGLSNDQLAAIADPSELVDTITNAVYNLPDSTFSETNNVSNLLVALGTDEPKIETLLQNTKDRQSYAETANIKHATLSAANYREFDGLTKFRNSDVALIKVSGSHFPDVSLGAISDVSQGDSLSILGYPGEASDNGIVSDTQDSVTLTTGKVSAIKTAKGDTRKLIETDTTIGHGNSGGPAFDEAGNVVGIATYTADGSGEGGGVFNFVRDIADVKTLAAGSHITIGEQSDLQKTWQKAINLYYASHYSASLKYFNQVKTQYPAHPTVSQFIANAQTAIKEGKDVKTFPLILLVIGAAVALIAAGVAVVLIVRHQSRHQIYNLATGQAAAVPVNVSAAQAVDFGGMVTAPGPQAMPPAQPAMPPSPVPVQPVAPAAPPVQPPQPPAPPQPPQAPNGPVVG